MTKAALTAKAAAAHCDMSPTTFRKERKAGRGPDVFVTQGGRVKFPIVALDRWLAERAQRDPIATGDAA